MKIGGMARTSTLDFPRRLCAVLFTAGCNYDCFYCHNRSLIDGGDVLEDAAVDAFLQARAGLLDGIVVSGGEPTLQPDLPEFFRKLKRLGYDTKLDTNGSRPDVVAALIGEGLVDYVAMDYKAPFGRYREIAGPGADPGRVRETLELLLTSGVEFELRTTVAPQLSNNDLLRMAHDVPRLPLYALQPYKKPQLHRPEDVFRVSASAYTAGQLKDMLPEIKKMQPHATVRD